MSSLELSLQSNRIIESWRFPVSCYRPLTYHSECYFFKFGVITARCTLVQSAVLRSHVVCLSVRLSVCLSVCNVGGSGSHTLEILETNCMDK